MNQKQYPTVNLDDLVKSRNSIEFVIPAKAGIQLFQDVLDPGFRRGDASRDFLRDHQSWGLGKIKKQVGPGMAQSEADPQRILKKRGSGEWPPFYGKLGEAESFQEAGYREILINAESYEFVFDFSPPSGLSSSLFFPFLQR